MERNLNLAATVPLEKLPRLLMITAGAGFIVGGGVLFALNNRVAVAQKAVDARAAEVASSMQVARQYDPAMATYTSTLAKISCLEKSMTPAGFVPTLLKQVQNLAAAAHVNVSAIRPSIVVAPAVAPSPGTDAKTPAAPAFQSLSVSLIVSGTYSDTLRFMYELNTFPKIVSVNSLQLHPHGSDTASTGSDANNTGAVEANLQLTAYIFSADAPAAEPGAVPTPPAPSTAVAATSAPAAAAQTPQAAVPSAAATTAGPSLVQQGVAALENTAAKKINANHAVETRAEVGVGTL